MAGQSIVGYHGVRGLYPFIEGGGMTTKTAQWSTSHTITAGIAGNVLEWYDFAIYGFFAPIIAAQFFPSDDPTVSLIASFGAFAAGFLMRPVGAALFGHIGDRYGRSRALLLSVLLMAVPTFLIGLLPTYATLGVAASVLMVVLRMCQGVAVGGEYTSSIVYLGERAPPGRRAFFSSWSMFGAVGGTLLGSAVGAVLSTVLSDTELAAWGWRVAFLGGIAVGAIGMLIRRGMHEDAPAQAGKPPLLTAFSEHGRAIAQVIGLNIANAVGFYLMFVYVVTWMVDHVQVPRSSALDINTLAMGSLLLFVPLGAWLSDRYGRRVMLIGGLAATAVLSYPLLWLMHHPHVALILAGQIGFALVLASFMGSIPAMMIEMFPKAVRVSAVSVGYNITLAIFGGSAPLVAVWMIGRSHDDLSMAWYLSGAAVVSLLTTLTMRGKPRPSGRGSVARTP